MLKKKNKKKNGESIRAVKLNFDSICDDISAFNVAKLHLHILHVAAVAAAYFPHFARCQKNAFTCEFDLFTKAVECAI